MFRFSLSDVTTKNRFMEQLFQISVALWFFRMVLPGMKYLLLPVYTILLLYIVFFQRKVFFQKQFFFEFLKTINPLIILGLFYLYALLITDRMYDRVMRDVFEYVVNITFLSVFFVLTYRAKMKDGFNTVFRKTTRIIWVSSLFVSILGLVKFYLQVKGYELPLQTPWGTAFNGDKNFFALYSMLGLIGLIPRLSAANTIRSRIVAYGVFLTIFINIVLSFAYRALFLVILIFLFLIILQIAVAWGGKNTNVLKLARNIRWLTVGLYLVGMMFFIGVFTKNKTVITLQKQYIERVTDFADTDVAVNIFHTERWKYTLQLFKDKPVMQKLFGSGFDYLTCFGERFNSDSNKTDYPHNPVLSALLYSGIVGAVFLLFFMLVSVYYATIYFNRHPLFSLMLYVSLIFVFFSGNSLFSVPVFLFLFSLSFLMRHQEISELNIDMNMHKPGAKFLKESFDYLLASLAIVILLPLLLIISVVVAVTMGWPVVYTQTRIGQNGQMFRLHKFRTMKKARSSTTVAAQEQNRITPFGKFLRKYKLDELPELWNIIRGDMSFVGPRPDVPGYADKLTGSDRVILQLKPGLTGAASLKYMDEEVLLAKQQNPQEYNDRVIFPDKVLVNKKYMQKWSLWLDFKIIILTAIGKSMHEDKFL